MGLASEVRDLVRDLIDRPDRYLVRSHAPTALDGPPPTCTSRAHREPVLWPCDQWTEANARLAARRTRRLPALG